MSPDPGEPDAGSGPARDPGAGASVPVFDGHNDTLTQLRRAPAHEARTFLERSAHGHLDLPRAREGGLCGGFFAIFTPNRAWDRRVEPLLDGDGEPVPDGYRTPLPPRLRRRQATRFTTGIVSDLYRLEAASAGALQVVRTASALRRCREQGRVAAVLHIEGAEVIDTRLEALDLLHAAGLRSLGPVWSRPNAFGHGVPFDFPRSPDTGPGLTAAGRRLVRRCGELGIVVDLSHLNEAGFWGVASISDAPLVATHSNAWALSPSPRNLTDAQLDAVGASGGVVGMNFNKAFLRADGRWDAPTSLTEIVRHARYVAERIGVEHVALGSDFDGATMPDDLPDVAALPRLLQAFREEGFSEEEVRRVAHGNWERVLEATWGG